MKVVEAALKEERRDGGWIKIDAPGVPDKELSQAIMEAHERGLVKGVNISNMSSKYLEWRLMGPTGASSMFIRENRTSKKLWAAVLLIGGTVVAFLGWLIPVLISLRKK
jgi:hypothetical protein